MTKLHQKHSYRFPEPLTITLTNDYIIYVCKRCHTQLYDTVLYDNITGENIKALHCFKCGSYFEQQNPPEKGGEK